MTVVCHSKVYRVGGNFGWSDLLWFRSLPSTEDTDWSPRLAIYGDLGSENAQSLPRLQRETQSEMYDMIIHVGDFAYDLDTVNRSVKVIFVFFTLSCIKVEFLDVCAYKNREKIKNSEVLFRESFNNFIIILKCGDLKSINKKTKRKYG